MSFDFLKKKIREDDLQIKKNKGPLVQACQGRPKCWTQQNGPGRQAQQCMAFASFFSNSFFKLMIFYGFFSNFF
jgi:hypothetical protein